MIRNIYINLILVCTVIFTSACQLSPASSRNPSGQHKAKHYIISVHGLSGDATTFQTTLDGLKNHLQRIDPGFEVETFNFTYATGNLNLKLSDFISSLKYETINYFSKPEHKLQGQDKISFISHSQGGLIAMHLFDSLINWDLNLSQNSRMFYKKSIDYQIASRLDSIVTIGSPFWGSKIAYILGDEIQFTLLRDYLYKKSKTTPNEIEGLAFGSEETTNLFIKNANTNVIPLTQVRVLNVIGVLPQWNSAEVKTFVDTVTPFKVPGFIQNWAVGLLKPKVNLGKKWESDIAVSTSSAKLEFLYYSDETQRLRNNGEIPKDVKRLVKVNNFFKSQMFSSHPENYYTEGFHITPDIDKLPSIATIQPQCISADQQCNHPSFAKVLYHLANCDRAQSSCVNNYQKVFQDFYFNNDSTLGAENSQDIKKLLETFLLSFNLRLPKNFETSELNQKNPDFSKYIKMNYVHTSVFSNKILNPSEDALVKYTDKQNFRLQVGRYRESSSRLTKYFPDSKTVHVQFAGNVKAKDLNNLKFDNSKQFPLEIEVIIPGLKPRKLIVPVQPTTTTFVDLELEQIE